MATANATMNSMWTTSYIQASPVTAGAVASAGGMSITKRNNLPGGAAAGGSTLRGMSSEASESTRTAQPGLGVAIARYGGARVALIAAIAGLLVWRGVPLLVSLLVALVAAMPLSMMLLPGLRQDLSAALARAGSRRSAQRARLRAQLRGEPSPEPSARPSAQPSPEPSARPSPQAQPGGPGESTSDVPGQDETGGAAD